MSHGIVEYRFRNPERAQCFLFTTFFQNRNIFQNWANFQDHIELLKLKMFKLWMIRIPDTGPKSPKLPEFSIFVLEFRPTIFWGVQQGDIHT